MHAPYRFKTNKNILLRSRYKEPPKCPEDIYKPFGLTKATFYRYAKILDNQKLALQVYRKLGYYIPSKLILKKQLSTNFD